MPTPPSQRPRRRNRTRQRTRLIEVLRESDAHPTAAQLYEALLPEFPQLSLGTVYRNLEVLKAEGKLDEVPTRGPALRYDGNLEPHHHFVCEGCGTIQDIALREPRALRAGLRRKYRLRARGLRVTFYGLCEECSDRDTVQ